MFYWLKVPSLSSCGRVSSGVVRRKFPVGCEVHLSDKGYDLFKNEDLLKVMKLNRFEEQKYVTEKRDCDNFCYVLQGHMSKLVPGCAFGICWGDVLDSDGEVVFKHAINCFIDQNRRVRYVEPQSNMLAFESSYSRRRFRPYLIVM